MGLLVVGDYYVWFLVYVMLDIVFVIKFMMVNGEYKDYFLYFYFLFVMVFKFIF